MRKTKSLLVGVLCGLACMASVMLYVQDVRAAVDAERAEALSRYGADQVEVCVASRDISAGSKADSTNVERKLLPAALLPEGAVSEMSQIEGQPAQADIYRGEVLVGRRFGESAGVSLQVPDGMCAVSVPAKAVSAVGGSVSPGAEVNVYSTTATATDLLIENARVLSTSAASSAKKSESADISWITLSVKPDMVSDLIAAAGSSELYFSLPSERLTASDVQSASKAREGSGRQGVTSSIGESASGGDDGKGASTTGDAAGNSVAANSESGKEA